jgi:hypothetical protein
MEEESKKKMEAMYCHTLRGMTEQVNAKGIQKEDIVQVLPSNEGFVLLYYK